MRSGTMPMMSKELVLLIIHASVFLQQSLHRTMRLHTSLGYFTLYTDIVEQSRSLLHLFLVNSHHFRTFSFLVLVRFPHIQVNGV